MAYGFMNKKDLPQWNEEDTLRAKNCKWMMDRQWKNCPDSFIDRIKECKWWYKKLMEELPSPERYELKKRLNNVSMFFNFTLFERKLQSARYDMVMKLLAYDAQKAKMIDDYQQQSKEPFRIPSIMEDYRTKQLTQVYPKGSPADIKQREEKVIGYVPIKEVLLKIPPMEIIEYCDFKLIKYDKWHGYYAIILVDNKKNIKVFYDENAQKVELQAEMEFDELIDKYLNAPENQNGYGNKSYNSVDISNIKQTIGYDNTTNNPLNSPEIF
jgi:hypothetical protein